MPGNGAPDTSYSSSSSRAVGRSTGVYASQSAAPTMSRPVGAYGGSAIRGSTMPGRGPAPPGHAPPPQRVRKSDPKAVLNQRGYPDSIDEWTEQQDIIWAGHSRLPHGWIRVWSQRHDFEYYLRLSDTYATFEFEEVE
eukprot:TRINITY_DN27944_c0_g1_i1.p1 TRINITY_DN27944_c0_g1~~TRINITY_DN27944_c0_g1_i1.p1  ORF type:complete len:138 (-),score=15.33 TRINITY_DN27944_c0_g1_i1:199-612(-)